MKKIFYIIAILFVCIIAHAQDPIPIPYLYDFENGYEAGGGAWTVDENGQPTFINGVGPLIWPDTVIGTKKLYWRLNPLTGVIEYRRLSRLDIEDSEPDQLLLGAHNGDGSFEQDMDLRWTEGEELIITAADQFYNTAYFSAGQIVLGSTEASTYYTFNGAQYTVNTGGYGSVFTVDIPSNEQINIASFSNLNPDGGAAISVISPGNADAYMFYNVPDGAGTAEWSTGIDNSDANKFNFNYGIPGGGHINPSSGTNKLSIGTDGKLYIPQTPASDNTMTTIYGRDLADGEFKTMLRTELKGYSELRFLLSQVGTSAPTVAHIVNEVAISYTWTRVSQGKYNLHANLGATPFTSNKTYVFIGNGTDTNTEMNINYVLIDNNDIDFYCYDASGALSDDQMTLTSIQIQVYP